MRKISNRRFALARFDSAIDIPVKSGLALSPQQMFEMSKRGVPISTSNCDMKDFGEESPTFDIPLDRMRGVDVATMWEHSQVIKNKAALKHAEYVKSKNVK